VEEMQKHVMEGYELVAKIDLLADKKVGGKKIKENWESKRNKFDL
jgi:hypothetical protein